MKIFISESNEKKYKRSDRVVLNMGDGEFALATITAIRSGKWYLLFDDGDKGDTDDINDIVGLGIARKRKAMIKKSELHKFLQKEKQKPQKRPANQGNSAPAAKVTNQKDQDKQKKHDPDKKVKSKFPPPYDYYRDGKELSDDARINFAVSFVKSGDLGKALDPQKFKKYIPEIVYDLMNLGEIHSTNRVRGDGSAITVGYQTKARGGFKTISFGRELGRIYTSPKVQHSAKRDTRNRKLSYNEFFRILHQAHDKAAGIEGKREDVANRSRESAKNLGLDDIRFMDQIEIDGKALVKWSNSAPSWVSVVGYNPRQDKIGIQGSRSKKRWIPMSLVLDLGIDPLNNGNITRYEEWKKTH